MSNDLAIKRAERELQTALAESAIPYRMNRPIELYVMNGIQPGSFLQHVIDNNLHGAAFTADNENIALLRDYARFFFNHVPPQAYGSTQRRRKWCEHGGLAGLLDREAAHA